jgi:hypothetical protein
MAVYFNFRTPKKSQNTISTSTMGEPLYKYVSCRKNDPIPPDAVESGSHERGSYYYARGVVKDFRIPGKVGVQPSQQNLLGSSYIPCFGYEYKIDDFEILTSKSTVGHVKCNRGDVLPEGAIEAGFWGGRSFHVRAKYGDFNMPGRVNEVNYNSNVLRKAYIPWKGDECAAEEFEVLVIEDLIESVEFDIDIGQGTTVPKSLITETLRNDTDIIQSRTFEYDQEVTHKSSFEQKYGFEIKTGMEFSCGIPSYVEGKTSLELSANFNITYGKEELKTESFRDKVPVKVPPRSIVECVASIKEVKLDVPYHITYKSGKVSGGIWHGISTWGFDVEYNQKELKDDDGGKDD